MGGARGAAPGRCLAPLCRRGPAVAPGDGQWQSLVPHTAQPPPRLSKCIKEIHCLKKHKNGPIKATFSGNGKFVTKITHTKNSRLRPGSHS